MALAVPGAAGLAAVVIPLCRPDARAVVNRVAAITVATLAAAAIAQTVLLFARGGPTGNLDLVGSVFLAVSAGVGLVSAWLSPTYLRHGTGEFFGDGPGWYYFAFYLFWAMLLSIPQAQNLGVAWVLVGVSTGVTCLLVAYSGSARALEAGWKYLILTTLGLVVALLGILILYGSTAHADESLDALDWSAISVAGRSMTPANTAVVLVLITVGFAAKIGWAPVHHWLPDAHSEAPAPVSAMLSAALLPTVVLVVWRLDMAMRPGDEASARWLLLAFGLVSLAVAVPFLWTPLPIKRVLAYSSLEHMGLIAVGLGFANPIATAGVLLHVAGHALAKCLGFQATMPLFARQPAAARLPLRAAAQLSPGGATALGISLGALSGLPPAPLFVSELMIMVGGVAAGQIVVVVVVALLLALSFIGLTRQTLDGLFAHTRHKPADPAAGAGWWVLPVLFSVLMLGLVALAWCVYAQFDWIRFAEAWS